MQTVPGEHPVRFSLRMCKLKFLQKLLYFDQIWEDCFKNNTTPFSESHLLTAEPCSSMLGHCSFAKIRCLPKLWAEQCLLSNLTLVKGFGCSSSMFLRKTHPKAATWARTNWAWNLKILWAASGSTDLLQTSSHTASWLCSAPACKKHLSPSKALTYCISFLPKSAPQSAFSSLVSTPRSRPCSPQGSGSPVQFGRCTGTGLQVPFWEHTEPLHVPGVNPVGLGVWASGAVMAFAPISHPKPTQYQRTFCPQGGWWQHEGTWPYLCATNGVWTDGVQWRERQPTDLWSAVKEIQMKGEGKQGRCFLFPFSISTDSMCRHPSNAWCRAGYWCYPAWSEKMPACLVGKKRDLQLLLWLCGGDTLSCHLRAAVPLRKVNDISNPLSC